MNLNKLFHPESIAIIGASTELNSVGNDVVKNLVKQGFEGKIYPVNPKASELYSLKCYETVGDIKEKIDLAVIAVPAVLVPQILEEAGEKAIEAAVVISAGFKESGRKDLENEVVKICKKYDIALIGPNCLGIINPEIKMNASFAAVMPDPGPVAFASQSGALCTAVIDYAKYYGVGFSKFVSIGNKAVIDDLELLKYLFEDEKTKVIAMYIESLTEPHELIDFMAKMHCTNPKPVIVLKSGRSKAGASASVSHTGSLAGSDNAYGALFRQAGMIRVDSVEEMFDLIRVFSDNEISKCDGVAVVTNAGGPGILATDELINNGMTLAKFDSKTIGKLKKALPPTANLHNPVDVIGDAQADRYRAALDAVADDKNVNSILVILTPQSMTKIEETAHVIAELKKKTKKPIVVSFMGEATVEAGVTVLQNSGVAAVNFPEQAAVALAIMDQQVSICQNPKNNKFDFKDVNISAVSKIFNESGKKIFPEAQALDILSHYGFPLLKRRMVKSADEASSLAPELGNKIALKIVSDDILHKTDVGGVMLDVNSLDAGLKYNEIIKKVKHYAPKAKIDGVLMMEMASGFNFEFILGSNKDSSLGNVIMVGLGGILVEILKDVTFGLAPICKNDAHKMLGMIKANKIFGGIRNIPPLDSAALIECLGRLSQFVTDFPQIKELDINPLLVLERGKGVKVLDARIVIE